MVSQAVQLGSDDIKLLPVSDISAVIEEVGARFGFGVRARDLVIVLVSYLFRESEGGVVGFIQRCRESGLPTHLASWLDTSSPAVLEPSPDQLETLLGGDVLQKIINRSGLSWVAAVPALCYVLPRVISLLAANGEVAPGIPGWVHSLIGNVISHETRETLTADSLSSAGTAENQIGPVYPRRSVIAEVLPLALLASVVYLGYRLLEPVERSSTQPVASISVVGAAQNFSPKDVVMALKEATVNFPVDSAVIPEEAKSTLDEAAKVLLKASPETVVEIAAHADSLGDPTRELTLSEARASAVRHALIDRGVRATALIAKGYGAAYPVASKGQEEGRLDNNRIQFALYQP